MHIIVNLLRNVRVFQWEGVRAFISSANGMFEDEVVPYQNLFAKFMEYYLALDANMHQHNVFNWKSEYTRE